MHTAKQLSIALVNKPGRLAAVLTAFNQEKVGLRAFCVMDSGARATLRLVPDDVALARSALETLNIDADESEVLLLEVSNQSGGLPRICQKLASEHMNVDYAYGSMSQSNGTKRGSLAVIKVNDLAKAQRVLTEGGSRTKKRPGRRPAYAR